MIGLPPDPRPLGATTPEAIRLCCEWMHYLGAIDTVIFEGEPRVCDLYSSRYLAWIFNSYGNVGIDLVDTAVATTRYDGRQGLIFFSGGVFPEAQDIATAHHIALLDFDAEYGSLSGLNCVARQIVSSGLA
jgi:hypothetical protein